MIVVTTLFYLNMFIVIILFYLNIKHTIKKMVGNPGVIRRVGETLPFLGSSKQVGYLWAGGRFMERQRAWMEQPLLGRSVVSGVAKSVPRTEKQQEQRLLDYSGSAAALQGEPVRKETSEDFF
jgi:hypothetical protein